MLVTIKIQHSAKGKSDFKFCLPRRLVLRGIISIEKYRIKDKITGIHKTIYGAKNVGLPNNWGKLRIIGMPRKHSGLSSVGTSAMNVAKNHTKQILEKVDFDLHVSNTTK